MLRLQRGKLSKQVGENFFTKFKLWKLKKKKWSRLKAKLRRNRRKSLFKSFRFARRFNALKVHRHILNTKRKLIGFYGLLKMRKLRTLIRLRFFKAYALKKYYFTNSFLKLSKFKSNYLVYLIQKFESFLIIILVRSNFFRSYSSCLSVIRNRKVFVNNCLVQNPWFNMQIGDTVLIKADKLSKKRFLYKRWYYRSPHLIVCRRSMVVIYSKEVTLRQLEYPFFLQWKLVPFIVKLKR